MFSVASASHPHATHNDQTWGPSVWGMQWMWNHGDILQVDYGRVANPAVRRDQEDFKEETCIHSYDVLRFLIHVNSS